MLQQPDVHQQRILELADFIEKSDFFDMGSWNCCIYGHIMKLAKSGRKDMASFWEFSDSPIERAMNWLGRPINDWHRMMGNDGQSKEQAASMLRHLAVTGEIPEDWNSKHTMTQLREVAVDYDTIAMLGPT